MYSTLPHFVLGYHGCDKAVAENVFSGKVDLKPAQNDYDWLGSGIYFWESSPLRALKFAECARNDPKFSRGKIKEPSVIGAIIDLGHCLNLLDSNFISLLEEEYKILQDKFAAIGEKMPRNTEQLRRLDCAVINALHRQQDDLFEAGKALYKFDSTRGAFFEGEDIYLDAGFKRETHLQICVRSRQCIKGYFRVKDFN